MIENVEFIPLVSHADDRGVLIEIIRKKGEKPMTPWSIANKILQIYLVSNFSKGIIRAFHKHEKLWDYFFIPNGSAKFILRDDRKESKTFNERNVFVISERNPSLLVIPPGVYHGWMSLEDDTQLISIASEVFNPEKVDEVRVPPNYFVEQGQDDWEVKGR